MTTLNSSSGHTVNGDRALARVDRLRWFALNWLNNSRATSNLDPALELCRFRVDAAAHWTKIDVAASPARRLCDLFWLSLPWQRIAAELGGVVTALEIGCGTGRYGALLRDCLGNAFGGYIGLDVTPDPQWSQNQSDPRMTFVCAGSGEVNRYLGSANLILTQSALEHFEEDMVFFRHVAQHVAESEHPTLQFHLMPSADCLTTFPWHGVRQYTPRTISRITRLFGPETSKRLYFLGAARCNRVHRRYITYPSLLRRGDQRRVQQAAYERDLREALQMDGSAPSGNDACFLALVLQSRIAADTCMGPAA